MTKRIDIERDPSKSIYETMAELMEDAGSALEKGDVVAAGALAEEASILGRALGILAKRADR